MRMMEEELRQLLQEQGWRLKRRTRGGRAYLYAQQIVSKEVYLSPANDLPEVTPEKVLSLLRKASGED